MPPPGLQIYLWYRVTLTFDLLTPKLTVSRPCFVDHLCQLAAKSVDSFSKYRVHNICNRRTDGHVESVVPPVSLDWPQA